MQTVQINSFEQLPQGINLVNENQIELNRKLDLLLNLMSTPAAALDAPKTYTRKEVADIFQVSLTTLDGYIHDGKIEATRFGTRVRFTRDAIDEALKKIQPAKKIA